MRLKFITFLLLFNLYCPYRRYYLGDGIEENVTFSSNSEVFNYYTQITRCKGAIFTIRASNSCKVISSYLWIYEYENERNYYTYTYETFVSNFKGKMNNNMCEYSYSHNISSPSSNYVAFETVINKDQKTSINIISRIDVIYEKYDLYYNKSLDIFNLSFNKSYYLFLEFFETVDICFIINNMTNNPFSNITIHEFESRDNSPSLRITDKSISFTKINDELKALFSYTSNFTNLTKYIGLKIKPNFNIPHIITKFEFPLTSIDLYNGIWKTIDDLIANEIYLFFIEAGESSKVTINLIINNTDENPFDYINIYEYKKKKMIIILLLFIKILNI